MDPFITTFTGRKINPLSLAGDDISIDDIAHHLALVNRFAGATREPYSVAQHSVLVSLLLEADGARPEIIIAGLLHDAAEAYLGDVTKWLKQTAEMEPFRMTEQRAQAAIDRKFGLFAHSDISVAASDAERLEEVDRFMVRMEALLHLPNQGAHLFAAWPERYPAVCGADFIRMGRAWRIVAGEDLHRMSSPVKSWMDCWSWQTAERLFLQQFRKPIFARSAVSA